MMQTLGFKMVNPITLVNWADWYSSQWDRYADKCCLHTYTESGDASFRQFTCEAYVRYRTLMQFVDAVALDFGNFKHSPRHLVAALLYVVIGSQQTMMVFPDYYQMAV